MTTIAFLSNKLTLRGTEVALYDYADYNESILGNKSVIITRDYDFIKNLWDVDIQAYNKFKNRFIVEYYQNTNDIDSIVLKHSISHLFIEKAGDWDGLLSSKCKNLIHCVFTTVQPHGEVYSSLGTTVNNIAVSFPTSGGSGIVDRGLYVGDANTPISASFYGEVNIKKQSIVQSYNTDFDTVGTVRLLELTSVDASPGASSALYANLTLSKTDPQFIYVNLKTPAAFTLSATNPIYLLLHEDFTTTTSRPVAGQTFTIILNNLLNNSNVEISTSTWPQAQIASGTAAAINIISGFTQTASAGTGALKSGYINGALWPTLPTTVTSAITKLTETTPYLQYVRLYNRNVQAAAIPKPRATSVSFTKTQHSTNFSYYTVTNSNNITIIN